MSILVGIIMFGVVAQMFADARDDQIADTKLRAEREAVYRARKIGDRPSPMRQALVLDARDRSSSRRV